MINERLPLAADEETKSSIRDLVAILFRGKWVVLGVLLAAVIPVIIYSLNLPDTYTTDARVVVKPGKEQIWQAPVGDPGPSIVANRDEMVGTEVEILKSRELARRVVRQIGISKILGTPVKQGKPSESEINSAISCLLSKLSVTSRGRMIDITCTWGTAKMTVDILNCLLSNYLERHLEVHQDTRSYDFFRAQANQLDQRLKTAGRELADFKKQYSIVSFDQRKNIALEAYMAALAQKQRNEADLEVLKERMIASKAQMATIPEHENVSQSQISHSGIYMDLKGKLNQTELERDELLRRFQPDNPKLVRCEKTIEKVKEMMAKEQEVFTGSINTAKSELYSGFERNVVAGEVERKELIRRGVELEKQLIEYGQELERLTRLEPKLKELERELSISEQNYKLYITKFEESRVSDAMDAAKIISVSILEPPVLPLAPLPVSRNTNIIISICLGAAAGIALVFLTEYFDNTIKKPEDLKKILNLPVLGSIKELKRKEKLDLRALAVSPAPPTHYQRFKTNVLLHAAAKGAKVFLLCSPTAGEGTSTLALNLAACLAKESNKRILLVDANMRTPSAHAILDAPVNPGFSEAVEERAELSKTIRRSVIQNLFVMPSGLSPLNPSAIFEDPNLVKVIESLKQDFDWVIFDAPPVNQYPDTILLAPKMDAVVMVIEAENKRAEIAMLAKKGLEAANHATLLGAVLNRRRHRIPEPIYRILS